MRDVIIQKIKRRESFRPFAPGVLKEHVFRYFEQDVSSPFIVHVAKVRPERRVKLPAVVHVDGSGRLRSVDRESNELCHDPIAAFARRTCMHMLLNTSFSENEPTVDSSEQAVYCLLRNDMDVLVVGPCVVTKPGVART